MFRYCIRHFFSLWSRTYFQIFLFCVLMFLPLILRAYYSNEGNKDHSILMHQDFHNREQQLKIYSYIEKRKNFGTMSVLGSHMFLFYNLPRPRKQKRFKILIWKIGKRLENRHIKFYTKRRYNPFQDCSVNNCHLTYKDNDLDKADAVLFSLHKFGQKGFNLPDFKRQRPKNQIWIFMTDEGQNHTFLKQKNEWYNYADVFNWSMSYKVASDIPVPNGRIIPMVEKIEFPKSMTIEGQLDAVVPFWDQKIRNVLVTNVMSNCGTSTRNKYIKELQNYIGVDTYGKCGKKELRHICPFKGYGHMCNRVRQYLFYLAFENCNCDEFIDEKVWTNGYGIGSIPIIMGSKKSICEMLLPPNSYIHVEDFESPKDLADFLIKFNNTFLDSMVKYHEWRKSYNVEESSGYAGARSWHYCRLCEALNYNDLAPKVYDVEMLRHFLDPETNCYEYKWKSK